MVIENNISSFPLLFSLFFFKENMWETLQNEHYTKDGLERERWWEDFVHSKVIKQELWRKSKHE